MSLFSSFAFSLRDNVTERSGLPGLRGPDGFVGRTPLLPSPKLISPEDQKIIGLRDGINISFRWQPVPEAASYLLSLSYDTLFSEAQVIKTSQPLTSLFECLVEKALLRWGITIDPPTTNSRGLFSKTALKGVFHSPLQPPSTPDGIRAYFKSKKDILREIVKTHGDYQLQPGQQQLPGGRKPGNRRALG